MDWYYPVLGGVLEPGPAEERLEGRRATFLVEGRGIRCVSDRPWITAAETCECLMAELSLGHRDLALDLFGWAQQLRDDDGHYWTGIVFPDEVHFPGDERSTYTAAAVILAADALRRTSPAAGLFVDHDALPALVARRRRAAPRPHGLTPPPARPGDRGERPQRRRRTRSEPVAATSSKAPDSSARQ